MREYFISGKFNLIFFNLKINFLIARFWQVRLDFIYFLTINIFLKEIELIKKYGKWIDVVVDDLLPYYRRNNKLFLCSNIIQPEELWGPLLEKAYAK